MQHLREACAYSRRKLLCNDILWLHIDYYVLVLTTHEAIFRSHQWTPLPPGGCESLITCDVWLVGSTLGFQTWD
jgi:hypothetical protein